MLISYSWLKNYVNLPDSISPEEVAEKLKMATVEVEKVENLGKNLKNIVVGKVLTAEKHPNANKLKVCRVDAGGEQLGVVCGGSNVAEGMLVALAKAGAKVRWHGEGELVELQPTEIRGVKSEGMICASTELGLGGLFPLKEEKEILDLSPLFKEGTKGRSSDPTLTLPLKREGIIGKPLAQVLGLNDAILEIDNKSLSHRPDLWGHYGIAREASALFEKKLEDYEVKNIKPGKEIKLNVKVEEKKLCPRYMAVAMSGVKIGPSPDWMQKALASVGLRPINNIVDITNYVMVDLGQPMHAFDGSQISDVRNQKTIIVRRANEGEEFKTFDGQMRKLDSSILVIADEEKALAIAGVMGGEDSGVTESARTIIFESANFNASSIRKASAKLGLRTDSSSRFEKGLDPNYAELALKKAVALVLKICPQAKVASGMADEANFHLNKGPLTLTIKALNKKTGHIFKKDEAKKILEKLGFAVKIKGEELSVMFPSWRATKDISIPEDLIEEIVRVHGFDKIEPRMPEFPISPPEKNELRDLERKIKKILVLACGFTEVYNYSFVDPATVKKMGEKTDLYIELDNPLSKERPYARRHLLTNLIENVVKNIEFQKDLKLFEVGKTYLKDRPGARVKENSDELLPRQDTWLSLVCVEKKNAYWEARRTVEKIFHRISRKFSVKAGGGAVVPWMHPAKAGEIMAGGGVVGHIYETHPSVLENFGIDSAVAAVDLNLTKLAKIPKEEKYYKSIHLYPTVERDLAFIVDEQISHESIKTSLLSADPLLVSVELFDVFSGGNVGVGKKSMAYHLVYQNKERTLTSEEVDKVHAKVLQMLKEKFGAEIRK